MQAEKTRERFARFASMERTLGLWLQISLAVMFLGVLIHLNLNFFCGISILFAGVALALLTTLNLALWFGIGTFNIESFVLVRRWMLAIKFVIVGIIIGLAIWTGVVMINRT